MEKAQEGCLSRPDISAEAARATSIKVKAFDEKGNKINRRYAGFLARVVQHELDHLDGKLIVDRGTAIYFPKEKAPFFDTIFHGRVIHPEQIPIQTEARRRKKIIFTPSIF